MEIKTDQGLVLEGRCSWSCLHLLLNSRSQRITTWTGNSIFSTWREYWKWSWWLRSEYHCTCWRDCQCAVSLAVGCVYAKISRHIPYCQWHVQDSRKRVRGLGNCFKTVSMRRRKGTGFGLFFNVARGTFDLSHSGWRYWRQEVRRNLPEHTGLGGGVA